MTDSLSPVALSRLTWTADDRQAWKDAYRAALWCAVRREGFGVVPGCPSSPIMRAAVTDSLTGYGRPMFSVHVDCMQGDAA